MILYFIKILVDYKKMIINIVFAIFLGFLFLGFVNYIENRNTLIEKFKIGIVIEDSNNYLDYLLNIGLSQEDLNKTIEFEVMDKETAENLLDTQKIPSYIIIPSGFTNSILDGSNIDIIFVANPNIEIPYKISEIVVKAGIAFLSSSQSGIYAMIDYATKNNIYTESAVTKINIEFGKALLSYKNYYNEKIVYTTGTLPIKQNYIYSILIFFIMIFGINFYNGLGQIFNKDVYPRLLIIGLKKILLITFVSVCLIYNIICIPAYYFMGFKTILLVVNLTSLLIFCSLCFKNNTSNGLFIFTLSLVMLFISGGIIPRSFLPQAINNISFLSINYYYLNNTSEKYIIYSIIFSVILMVASLKLYKKRVEI